MFLRLTCLSFLTLLAGCVGGTTYGTGVTQESQLLSDVTGLVAFGSRKPAKRINYSARPGLVRAPNGTGLPQPEEANARSGSFPVDPEVRRAAAVQGADTSADHGPRTVEGVERPAISKPKLIGDLNRDLQITSKERKKISERVRAARKRARGATGSGPRRYLTDPPAEYRTPAETAAGGEVGTREKRSAIKFSEATGVQRD